MFGFYHLCKQKLLNHYGMKRILLSSLLAVGMTASAQQLQLNPDNIDEIRPEHIGRKSIESGVRILLPLALARTRRSC